MEQAMEENAPDPGGFSAAVGWVLAMIALAVLLLT